jgi:hypothetical protein
MRQGTLYGQTMKMKLFITMSILAAGLQFTPIVCAEDTNDAAKGGRRHAERWANLPADEREKLKAAHDKAMNDPAVKAKSKMRQARKEFRDAMHAAMLRDDPSLQPILDKMPKGGKGED